jgi:hypothetical protein
MILHLQRLPPCLARFVAVCQFVYNLGAAEFPRRFSYFTMQERQKGNYFALFRFLY